MPTPSRIPERIWNEKSSSATFVPQALIRAERRIRIELRTWMGMRVGECRFGARLRRVQSERNGWAERVEIGAERMGGRSRDGSGTDGRNESRWERNGWAEPVEIRAERMGGTSRDQTGTGWRNELRSEGNGWPERARLERNGGAERVEIRPEPVGGTSQRSERTCGLVADQTGSSA